MLWDRIESLFIRFKGWWCENIGHEWTSHVIDNTKYTICYRCGSLKEEVI